MATSGLFSDLVSVPTTLPGYGITTVNANTLVGPITIASNDDATFVGSTFFYKDMSVTGDILVNNKLLLRRNSTSAQLIDDSTLDIIINNASKLKVTTQNISINNSVGIGEHSNLLKEISEWTQRLAEAEENISILNKHFVE